MAFKSFAGIDIFRPSLPIEAAIRNSARGHLFSAFPPGEYRGERANRVIQHQFRLYQQLLEPLIPRLSSRGAAEFFLYQYDQAFRLVHGEGILNLKEREQWAWIEPRLKRAIKFLLETICMADPREAQSPRDSRQALAVCETALACAESMAHLAMESDIVHSVFPRDSVVRVFESGVYDFTIDVEGDFEGYDEVFSERVIRDRNNRDKIVPSPQFDNHTPTHQQFLDAAFKEEFGATYGEFIHALVRIISDCQESLHPSAFPTLFVNRRKVIQEFANAGWSRTAVERAIDGFSITRSNLIAEKRVIWKPKQESRAYRRGFFVLPHDEGPHLAFSRSMARESLLQLVNWVTYQRLPSEWRTGMTKQASTKLARRAGRWFEQIVRERFSEMGIAGSRTRRHVGSGPASISIPEAVGEIDFLGYHRQHRLLVVAEAKMALTGLEAAYWRDDLDQFVTGRDSYAQRFRRKLDWVAANRNEICEALSVEPPIAVGAVLITLYPCIARAFISDFECVSLTEFVLDYREHGGWPYRFI